LIEHVAVLRACDGDYVVPPFVFLELKNDGRELDGIGARTEDDGDCFSAGHCAMDVERGEIYRNDFAIQKGCLREHLLDACAAS
jgi:hypothetical protein